MRILLFKAVRELLANVVKHARFKRYRGYPSDHCQVS
jgi:glucose-6-phosphate-specific signal transduction histidine kinase